MMCVQYMPAEGKGEERKEQKKGGREESRLPVHGHCEREREEQEGELSTERPRQNQSSERAPFPYTHPLGTPTHRRTPQIPKGQSFPALTCHNRCPLHTFGP